jgi:hypothetical protein
MFLALHNKMRYMGKSQSNKRDITVENRVNVEPH